MDSTGKLSAQIQPVQAGTATAVYPSHSHGSIDWPHPVHCEPCFSQHL